MVRPYERPVLRPAGEHARGPLVVTGALFGVVRAWVPHAVVHEVERRIVGQPPPHRRPAALPHICRPRAERQVFACVVERPKGARPREHLTVRPHVVRGPEQPPGRQVERLQPAVDAELPARRAHEHAILDDERRHRRGLALRQIADLGLPQLAARRRVDRDRVAVQQVVDDLARGVEGAAVDRVAARDADGVGIDVGTVLPFERVAFLREIERVEDVRVGRDDVHRGVHYERLAFVSAEHAGGEAPHRSQPRGVRHRDLGERAVARAGVILRRHGPFSVVAGRLCARDLARAAHHREEKQERFHCGTLPAPLGRSTVETAAGKYTAAGGTMCYIAASPAGARARV